MVFIRVTCVWMNKDTVIFECNDLSACIEGSTHEHGPRLTVSQENRVPVWWGVNTFTSNMAVGCGPT